MRDSETAVGEPETPDWYPSPKSFELVEKSGSRLLWRGPHSIEREAILQKGKPVAIITRSRADAEPNRGSGRGTIQATGWQTGGRLRFNADGTVEVTPNSNAYLSEKAATMVGKREAKGKKPLYKLVCRIRDAFINPNPLPGQKGKVEIAGLPDQPDHIDDALAEASIDACKHELYTILNMVVRGDDSGLMDLAEAVKIHRQTFMSANPLAIAKATEADLKRINIEADGLIRMAKRETQLSPSEIEIKVNCITRRRDLKIDLINWTAPRAIANRRKVTPAQWGHIVKAVKIAAEQKWKILDLHEPGGWGPIPSREEVSECLTKMACVEGLKGNDAANINLAELRTYLGQLGFGWLPTKKLKQ